MKFATRRPTFAKYLFTLGGFAVALSACGGESEPPVAAEPTAQSSAAPEPATEDSPEVILTNDGTTEFEGHTPLGFQGSGVGLFAGDNLNPNFPNGEGIQILLHFALDPSVQVPETAILRSDVMSTRGDVFEALGELQAAPVSYETFSSELWNIEPTGDAVTCDRLTDTSLSCDVTDAARAAIEAGDDAIQIQLTLEQVSDSDGEQDLVLFNNGDSNINEPGLFTLNLS